MGGPGGERRLAHPPDQLTAEVAGLWARHDAAWRAPAQIAAQWQDAGAVDPRLLQHTVRGAFWDTLAATGGVLLVTREYEHLVMALGADARGPAVSFMAMPHPSGLAVDTRRGVVHVASTRNPNQVHDLMPVTGLLARLDLDERAVAGRPLVPVRSRAFPGCLYMHDLALIGGVLHANAVGQNAVVRLDPAGRARRVWWPRCIETATGPVFGRNHLQLNSIAAGATLGRSYFSASTDQVSARRPGHRHFPVDGRGVIFSGATREPVVRGLTRPHSARRHRGRLWVDNSGYGEVGVAEAGRFVPVTRLSGWTRGLAFHGRVAFVGVSRVLPRFRQYAPGVDADRSVCGVFAVDAASGRVLGSLEWPWGNQLFAVEWAPRRLTTGLPFAAGRRPGAAERTLFYAFRTRGDRA
ncbi:MAG TPA: DUF4915 domain-containing protein [Candidatus Limnocylindrales bacterium]|nr:DUF4915 domain-containing protein [Candidatus Limnocylindrales bacterium]